METAMKSKIAVLIFAINILGVHCAQFQQGGDLTAIAQSLKVGTHGNSANNKVKRSLDWSKRISKLAPPEVPIHEAAESEHIGVTSKPARIVRRMRIQKGRNEEGETIRENKPDFYVPLTADGRRKIIKIKKIRRKPVYKETSDDGENASTTESTSLLSTTTTSTTTTVKPTTIYPKITPIPSYSHITVINKETINPKKNKKKKKNRKQQLVPTPPYDTRVKHNGFEKIMGNPNMHNFRGSDIHIRNYDEGRPYPDYGGYYNKRDPYTLGNKFKETNMREGPIIQFANPQMRKHYFDPSMIRTMQLPPSFSKDTEQLSNPTHYTSNRNRFYVPQNDDELMQLESTTAHNKDTSKRTQLKEIRNNDENNSNLTLSTTNTSTEVSKPDLSTELPLVTNKSVESVSTNKTVSEAGISNPSNKSEINSSLPEIPKDSDARDVTPQQERFPSRYPSLLYGKQNAFSDPFFDTPEFSTPIGRNRPSIAPWNHPLSPFYTSDDTRGEGYLYDDEDQSDDLAVPGFRHSPQLASLRRSIIHTYDEDETTTSEPVTPFSLPKFEMPSIDFNDKGCQTVYKEVKTVPGNGPESRNSNAKSFVMTRECYFPNGVPTTEETHTDLISDDSVTEKAVSEKKVDVRN